MRIYDLNHELDRLVQQPMREAASKPRRQNYVSPIPGQPTRSSSRDDASNSAISAGAELPAWPP